MVSRLFELLDKNKKIDLTDKEMVEALDLIAKPNYSGKDCLVCYPKKTGNEIYDTRLCEDHALDELIDLRGIFF